MPVARYPLVGSSRGWPITQSAFRNRIILFSAHPKNFYLRRLIDCLAIVVNIEEFVWREAKGVGEYHHWKLLDHAIVSLHHGSERATGGGNAAQCDLHLLKVGVGLEIWVGFRQRK